jgi:hypothetical protein
MIWQTTRRKASNLVYKQSSHNHDIYKDSIDLYKYLPGEFLWYLIKLMYLGYAANSVRGKTVAYSYYNNESIVKKEAV